MTHRECDAHVASFLGLRDEGGLNDPSIPRGREGVCMRVDDEDDGVGLETLSYKT